MKLKRRDTFKYFIHNHNRFSVCYRVGRGVRLWDFDLKRWIQSCISKTRVINRPEIYREVTEVELKERAAKGVLCV